MQLCRHRKEIAMLPHTTCKRMTVSDTTRRRTPTRRQSSRPYRTIPTILARLEQVVSQNGYEPAAPGDLILLPAAGICMDRLTDAMCIGRAAIRWQPGRYHEEA